MRKSFFSIILTALFLFLPFSVSAQDESLVPLTPSSTPIPQRVQYDLPYPGILPDNPLYFLKATRDRVISFLITDPLKKTQFDVLQADKRLQMGIYLVMENNNKTQLAITTISKGENYFAEAVGQVEDAHKQGINIDMLAGKMQNAVRKHEEVLKGLAKKATGSEKQSFVDLEQRVEGFDKTVSQFVKK